MSIEIVNPGQPIHVTGAAQRHFLEQSRKAGQAAVYLRLKESGCTGYMYVLDFVSGDPGDAQSLPLADGLVLYVDRQSLPMLTGTEIDYVREGLNSELRFNNPNAGDHCGCGESFSIDAGIH